MMDSEAASERSERAELESMKILRSLHSMVQTIKKDAAAEKLAMAAEKQSIREEMANFQAAVLQQIAQIPVVGTSTATPTTVPTAADTIEVAQSRLTVSELVVEDYDKC